jgi:Putative Se/S carrier protein-like
LSEKNSITYFFLFRTVHDVLKAENALKDRGASFELVPVPRALSSECGVCIASERPSDEIISLLFSINVDRCFSFDGNKYMETNPHGLRCSCIDETREEVDE